MNDTDLFGAWLLELAAPDPDPQIVATLEADAEQRGLPLTAALGALTAARGSFNPDLHPRGKDGKFIEIGRLIELFDIPGAEPGQRGKVTDIKPNRSTPGRPDINVQLLDRKTGKPGRTIRVKPNQIGQAREKARLDLTPGDRGGRDRFDEPRRPQAPQEPRGEAARLDAKRKGLAREARSLPDEQLAEQAPTAGPLWREAITNERANRAKRRLQDEARRQELIDDVNAQAATLSTTDPEARAEGLDKILAKLRFSIIDTDKVHDHIYPPGESGRWTPERAAQHEEMWDELLASVDAAGIPKDKDAFVLGGLPGAGKSYSLRPGQKADRFGVKAWETNAPTMDDATHVSINPDIVKEMLIARGMLPEGLSDDLKPMEKVTFLHEESSYLAKLFSKRLGDEGYNIVLDNTMDSEGGMLKRMTPLAREGYTFRGLFVDIPIDESRASAKKRYIDGALTPEGGRFVPSSVQGNRKSSKGNMSKNRDAMDTLVAKDWFKEWMVVDNTGVINRTPKSEVTGEGSGAGSAAGAYLPRNDKNRPKQGPRLPTAPTPPPTIDVNAPIPPKAVLPEAPAAPAAPLV